MWIASITAGAGGMFCGSCLRDNALASALIQLGHDALLVPTFTPITTDETDVSQKHVFLGGVNVYLQQKTWLFRHVPRFFDALFNNNGLLRWAGGFVGRTDYSKMGAMTISMLKGTEGRQKSEVLKLVEFLKKEIRPEIVLLTNALLSGCVPELSRSLKVPILTTLQGDDVFLDGLPEADRKACIREMQRNDAFTAGYLATSVDYAEYMAGYLGIDRGKIEVVLPGLNPKGHAGPMPRPVDRPPTLGFFARFAPEKGFHNAVTSYVELREQPEFSKLKFRYGGWLGERNRPYFEGERKRLADAGYAADCEWVPCPDHASKVRFFQSIDALSVPVAFREPKGLYVLEAWANGVPVVQPHTGSFPQSIERTGGGLTYDPGKPGDHVAKLAELLSNLPKAAALGRLGHEGFRREFTARHMAEATLVVLARYTEPVAARV